MNVGTKPPKRGQSIFEPIHDLEFDQLGRNQFARRLLNRVSAPDCSSTIGLYGGWGAGKTSILNLMQTLNDREKIPLPEKPLLEYVDVWPYEVSGDLSVPILVRMREWMAALEPDVYAIHWRRVFSVLAQVGMDIALRKILDLRMTDVHSFVDRIKDIEHQVDDIRNAQDSFCTLTEMVSKLHQNRRIVFLVDNLDRCSPENVVRLLESIKNFLHAPHCVWVFAMDSGVIASYIDHKYEGTRMDGNSYLDKIVPEQYHIPPVSEHDMTRLNRFLERVLPAEQHQFPMIDIERIPQLPEVLVPRRLLKTAHKFHEAYTADVRTGSTADPQIVFLLILLYYTWPAFYEYFSSGKAEHVRGILSNFMDQSKEASLRIPLLEKYTDDRSLRHYLNHCFIHAQDLEKMCATLAGCMTWLREIGLP